MSKTKLNTTMKGYRQFNLPEDCGNILDYFSNLNLPDGIEHRTYPQTLRWMASLIDKKRFGKK